MSKRSKVSRKIIRASAGVLLLLFFITCQINAKNNNRFFFFHFVTTATDTIPQQQVKKANTDSTAPAVIDTTVKPNSVISAPDSLFYRDTANADTTVKQRIDSLLISKDTLDAPIEYTAEDSGVLFVPARQFYLYGKANTKNKDVDLTANNIQYNQSTQTIKAYGGTDTANNPLSKPTLKQGDQTSISDTISFNIKSQRGITQNSYYNEGEIYVNATRVKKVSKDEAFAFHSRFTTCNLDTPHFAFVTKKMKIVNNKIAVSGPAHPEFEGVPVPVYIPFGIYPLNRGRHSGLLPVQFTTNNSYGLGAEGIGYYKVVNDNWDVTVRGNIYSYGGWTLDINPKYFKRYKYNGNLNLEIQNTKILNSSNYGFSKEEFTKTKSFFVTWTHSQDVKAHPGVNFSASVHAGSTRFNDYVPDNPIRNYTNQLASSITYSKTWDQGKYNLTVSANHNQNNILRLQNISLPTLTFTANTIYPFEQKELIGSPKWYEKLGISYSGRVLNQFSFYDTAFNFKHILDTSQWGAEHNIPISLSLPAIGPLIISPSVSYSERWFGNKTLKEWDEEKKKVDTTLQRGFYTARQMSFGLTFNTRIFGTVNFPKSKKLVAIRHEIKPTIGFNYTPDLVSQYYETIQVDSAGRTQYVSQIGNNTLQAYSPGRSGTVSFGLDNLFEAKVKNKSDSTGENPTNKIKLIDALNIYTGYNLLADSLNWSPISINFRSTLFKKVNITGNASISPYDVDGSGGVVNNLLWRRGEIGRLTNASLAVSTSLQSKSKDGKTQQDRIQADETLTPDEQMAQLDYIRENAAQFVDFDIPWTLQLSFSTNATRIQRPNFVYYTQITSSLNANGDFSLTPKWKIGGSLYFDVRALDLTMLTMYITRDMHCWQMAINLTPVGRYRSFSIVLNPKSGILRDLKINRTRNYYDF